MEVHHHSHTERKKWTHYFWEFLMLFLAVFAGFLAENQREHIVEHKRAKIYATSLYKELQKDTAELNSLIPWTDTLIHRFDTLCALSRSTSAVSNGKLYLYSQHTASIRYFSSESATMDQLKSSGNLRIIEPGIALKISEYQRRLYSLENDYSFFRTEYETMNGLRMKIFDGVVSVELSARRRDPYFRDSVFKLNPGLISNDPGLMKEFLGWVKTEADFWNYNVNYYLKPLKKTAEEILELLEKEYHLK